MKKTDSELPDFLFQLFPTFNPNKPIRANTEIQVYISKRYLLKKVSKRLMNLCKALVILPELLKSEEPKPPFKRAIWTKMAQRV